MRRERGFTLLELMIAVIIVGVLASIALPSYQNSIIKGNRASAQSFLMDIAQKEQQYLLDNRAYTATLSDLGLAIPDTVSKFYTVTITPVAGPPPGFVVTAAPIAGKKQAGDGTLTIDNTGAKTPTDKW